MLTGKSFGTTGGQPRELRQHYIQSCGQLLCSVSCPTDTSEVDVLFRGNGGLCSETAEWYKIAGLLEQCFQVTKSSHSETETEDE